jgi:hypothetical protein
LLTLPAPVSPLVSDANEAAALVLLPVSVDKVELVEEEFVYPSTSTAS